MQQYAVFIHDPESVGEFIGLARVDTEADDSGAAAEKAIHLHGQWAQRSFSPDDVALVAQVASTTSRPFGTSGIRVF